MHRAFLKNEASLHMQRILVMLRADETDEALAVVDQWRLLKYLRLAEPDAEMIQLIRPDDYLMLGLFSYYGYGPYELNFDQAAKFCALGIDSGRHTGLTHALAGMIESSPGRNHVVALDHFKRAAMTCYVGLYELSLCYKFGTLGVARDELISNKYVIDCAEGKYPPAVTQFGIMLLKEGNSPHQAKLRFLEAAAVGEPTAMMCLGDMARDDDQPRVAASYYRECLAAGDRFVLSSLLSLQESNPDAVIPFGEWKPIRFYHMWVNPQLHTQIRTMLCMHRRFSCVLSTLNRDLLYHICSWLVTLPKQPPQPSAELHLLGETQRQLFRTQEELKQVKRDLAALTRTVQVLLMNSK